MGPQTGSAFASPFGGLNLASDRKDVGKYKVVFLGNVNFGMNFKRNTYLKGISVNLLFLRSRSSTNCALTPPEKKMLKKLRSRSVE